MSMSRTEAAKLLESARDPALRKVLSRASGAILEASGGQKGASEPAPVEYKPGGRVKLVLIGGAKGGKNSIKTTRTGRRYPDKKWAQWRDFAVAQIKSQLPAGWKPITEHVSVELDYYSGTKRRHDMPAIIDVLWTVMEKAGVSNDDYNFWITRSSRTLCRENPRAEITLILP